MHDAKPESNNLASLANRAASQVAGAERARARRQPRQDRRLAARLLTTMLLVGGAYGAYGIWSHFALPTTEKVVRDLGLTVERARDSVEEFRAKAGVLPEALPNASLAALVSYETNRTQYRLSAVTGGKRVTIDWDGTKQVDQDSEPTGR